MVSVMRIWSCLVSGSGRSVVNPCLLMSGLPPFLAICFP